MGISRCAISAFFMDEEHSLQSTSRPRSRTAYRIWGLTFAMALLLYVSTAHRGVQWQDSGAQQYRILTGQLEHPRGLALAHPVQYYLGRAAIRVPRLEPAFAITLVSAVAGAVAAANLALTIQLLTRSWVASGIAAVGLTLSHTFWQHATHTESYALTAALLTAEWLMLAAFAATGREVFLPLLGLLNGVGIANHLLAALVLPVNAILIVWAVRHGRCTRRTALIAAVLWIIGTLPFTSLVVHFATETGDLGHAIRFALVGDFAADVFNTHLSGRMLCLSVAYTLYNFPGLTVPLAFLGICQGLRRAAAPRWLTSAVLAELVIFALFVVRYPIRDQYMYFFPIYLLLALLAGIGLSDVVRWRLPRVRRTIVVAAAMTAIWTPMVFIASAAIARWRGLFPTMVLNKPYRDGYQTFFLPWGVGDNACQQLNRAVAESADGSGIVLVNDSTMLLAIRYAQEVDQIPKDVEIMPIRPTCPEDEIAEWRERLTAALAARRPVVLVTRDRDHPRTYIRGAVWKRRGDIYLLAGMRPDRPLETRLTEPP